MHAHILAARCDLTSGQSLNVAPGWQRTFDPLRDAFNYEHGWRRPDDPARARAYRPEPLRASRDATALPAELAVEPDPRQRIGEYVPGVLERVTAGTVRDRAGVVTTLGELGLEVARQGRHYVTARHPDAAALLTAQHGHPQVAVRLQPRPRRRLELVEDGFDLGVGSTGSPVLHGTAMDRYLCSKASESATATTGSGSSRTPSHRFRSRSPTG